MNNKSGIEDIVDKAFKDAIFAMIVDNHCKEDSELEAFIERFDKQPETIDFDLSNVTELEVTAPESLIDLRFFPKLERLIVSGYTGKLYSDLYFWNDKLKEIILRKDLG